MSVGGKAAAAALVCAAVVAGVILLWSAPDTAPTAPTSDRIKASAQARPDASLKEGRTTRQVIRESGKTPSDELCQMSAYGLSSPVAYG
ncbi:hypothetical protein [Streptomyces kebangsaanensis]|uniref:hypothetical protein n=1 Tax=Streptomyces kebangsaanensis TaxID=864058 RepID=UPI00093DB9D3|nr:hypothetical protein [Streptomyces kebangsaanensis]